MLDGMQEYKYLLVYPCDATNYVVTEAAVHMVIVICSLQKKMLIDLVQRSYSVHS